MYIRCPKCGRRGHLPDRWAPEAHSLRCRKCRALFQTPELTGQAAERGAGPGFDSMVGNGPPEAPAAFLADGFFSGFDGDLDGARKTGPGDSSYELTFTLQDAEGDSDWDADTDEMEAEAPSSDEIPATSRAVATPEPAPWHRRFIASWVPGLIATALALIAVSVPLIAYLLWRTLGSAQPLAVPASPIIAGLAALVGLLMIAVPLLLLAAASTELARDVRPSSRPAESRVLLPRD